MKKVPSKSGFTLIELVLVTVILTVVGMVLYGTFANGINIWKRVTQRTVTEDINLFFEKISYDLRNSFKMTGMAFRGGKKEVSFPTRIRDGDYEGAEHAIGRVTYSFDRRKKTLNREEADYSEAYTKKPGRKRILAGDISSLQFHYYIHDPQQEKYSWVTSWQENSDPFGEEVEENLPLIVRIEIGVPDGRVEQKFVKTVAVPSACCWPFLTDEN